MLPYTPICFFFRCTFLDGSCLHHIVLERTDQSSCLTPGWKNPIVLLLRTDIAPRLGGGVQHPWAPSKEAINRVLAPGPLGRRDELRWCLWFAFEASRRRKASAPGNQMCAALGGPFLKHLGHRLPVIASILGRAGRERCRSLGKPAAIFTSTGSSLICLYPLLPGQTVAGKGTLQNSLSLLSGTGVSTEHQRIQVLGLILSDPALFFQGNMEIMILPDP